MALVIRGDVTANCILLAGPSRMCHVGATSLPHLNNNNLEVTHWYYVTVLHHEHTDTLPIFVNNTEQLLMY